MTDLVVRTRLSISSATSDFCSVGTSTFWYPVAPGTTTLPAPPASTTNASPLPANAVAIPEDFDPTNLCYLFQDLLPVNQGPVFPSVLTPAVNFQPYTEIVPTEGVTYTSLTITEYPYALTLPTGTIDLPTKAALTYVIPITGEAGSFTLTGQAAGKLQGHRITGGVGAFALSGQESTLRRPDRIFPAGAGAFTHTGEDAQMPWQRLPFPAEAGGFTLTGEDAGFLFLNYYLLTEADVFTLAGQDATFSRPDRVAIADAATFVMTGQNAGLGQTDPNFSSVGLLLHMDGSNNGTSFVDSSANAFTVSRSGNVETKTAVFKFGTASAYFDGNMALSVPDNSAWTFGSGDFTVELWVYFTATSGVMGLFSHWSTFQSNIGWALTYSFSTGNLSFQVSSSGSSRTFRSQSWSPSASTWYHVAITRSGTALRHFVNGTQLGSGLTDSTNIFNSTAPLLIGSINDSASSVSPFLNEGFVGYIDDVRITKGVARYTANFTAPAGPFPDS